MTEKHRAAIAAGKARAKAKRRIIAIEKVTAFEAWSKAYAAALASGLRRPKCPGLPTDQEYRLARGEEDDA